MISGEERVKRLRWKARRGLKELDVLFEAFFKAQAESIAVGNWSRLERLLDQEDTVIFGWVSGKELPDDPEMLNLIKTLGNAL